MSCRAALALLISALIFGCGTRTLDIGIPVDGSVDEGGGNDSGIDANVPGGSRTVVVSYFRIGLTTRDGADSKDAWKTYGFDLDGICTTTADSATSKGTCKRAEGSKTDVLTDGDACIDNNFGSQLVPLIRTLQPATETNLVAGIKKGGVTLALRIDDLAPSGSDPWAPAALFAAKAASGAANLDGNDVLDVDAISVTDGDLSKPRALLSGSVGVVGGVRTWTGRADLIDLPAVFVAGAGGTIPIHGARIDVDLDSGRGTVGGWALATDIQAIVAVILGKQAICPGNSLFDQVMTTITQAADMPEALPHETGQTCISISLGLGLETVGGSLGKTYPTPAPAPDPCKKG